MITAFCMPRAFACKRLDELIFCVGIICWITWYMYYETSHLSVGPTGYTGPESVWNPLPGYPPMRTLLFSLNHFFLNFCSGWQGCNSSLHCISSIIKGIVRHGPHTRYINLWVAHAPGVPGTFSLPPTAILARITACAKRTCRDACRNC